MFYLISCSIGYIFGCIHGSQIIGKIKGRDIKNEGVKNAGASNTTILLGWKYGIIVAMIDIFKATLAILLVLLILGEAGISPQGVSLYIYLTALFVIIGHNYPVTMKFSGGKGTASLVGALIAIDWRVAFTGIGILLLLSFATDYLVIGVLFMYISFLITTFYFFGNGPLLVVTVLTLLCIYKHMENYRRIMAKEETKLSSMFKKSA
ncbi:glycerol-3-phosphate acyltransferase [Oceanobacillus sp. J11TS1]|uniref:glycerol-3-phosphate acyltransferase n=1 Tax=Oceanobacillus sp. J11TS1 TaxID=2807191 RepID=UPI001B07986A|nr:glycerol-3-phosphate acyltransferase [Oceanobacillus sp. J11TS1]GIO24575.1 glycerol-3-phosphate acyltransferase [Oceanobacillus sp. J11TS1]